MTVRITSSNPALLLVSRAATTVGTASVDIPVASGGSTDATYYIHGVEGARGTVTLTATATGFTQAQGSATVGEPALLLGGVPANTTTLSTSTAFYVYPGSFERLGPVRRLSAGARRGGERDDHREQQQCGGGAAGEDERGGPDPDGDVAAGDVDSPTTVAAGAWRSIPLAGGMTTVSTSATAGFGRRVPVDRNSQLTRHHPVVGAGTWWARG